MSDELIVKHCSPTLAGMKTGNMFTYAFTNSQDMKNSIRKINNRLRNKGLRVLPLREQNGKTLIYVFRPELLKRDLKCKTACRLLSENGYCCNAPHKCVKHLMSRLNECDGFPHEIGLFLGYPPDDVCAFIENKGAGCRAVGCWKVYSNEDEAVRTFAKFKKCTTVYCSQLASGNTIERLTVAV